MGKSDRIEAFILELLKQEQEDWLKIRRNELAEVFGCVPSQINYVIDTRFNYDRGYIVESRRGGGGYVMIKRRNEDGVIGSRVSESEGRRIVEECVAEGGITRREGDMLIRAVSGDSLRNAEESDTVRADILKNVLKLVRS